MGVVSQLLSVNDSDEQADIFLKYVNDSASTEVYMGFEPAKDMLNRINIPFLEVLSCIDPDHDSKQGKAKYNGFFTRRNRIVHQADRSHIDASFISITPKEVESLLDDLSLLTSEIASRALRQDLSEGL